VRLIARRALLRAWADGEAAGWHDDSRKPIYTSRPLTRPLEVTGEMTARLWAATGRTDTDRSIMLLDV